MKSSTFAVVLSLLLAFSIGAAVQEPKTGVSFDEKINQSGSDLVLAGVGVRTKM